MEHMYYDELTKQYPISKTLRNELVPVGKTLENIKFNQIIESDKKRKDDYKKVKVIFDEYHKLVINTSLKNVNLSHLDAFVDLYFKNKKTDAENKKMKDEQTALRKEIVAALKKHENYGILEKKEIIQKLDHFVTTEEEHDALSSFSDFFTYLKGYTTVRANLYSDEEKSSTVAYRMIHENLPRFLDNIIAYRMIRDAKLQVEGMSEEDIDTLFIVDTYNFLLTQEKIELYNKNIGSINSAINLYNQQNKTVRKLPMLKVLYKQILSDRAETFIAEFGNDSEVIENLESLFSEIINFIESETFNAFLEELKVSQGKGVYVKNNTDMTSLSVIVSDSWRTLTDMISADYDANYTGKKSGEKYEEEKEKLLKKIDSYELHNFIQLGLTDLIDKYIVRINEVIALTIEKIGICRNKLEQHDMTKKLAKNISAVDAVKEALDTIKSLERDLKVLLGSGKEVEKNYVFYGLLDVVIQNVSCVDNLYNMTRNYLTKKPFSTDKVKLNFNKSTFLGSWDRNMERAYLCVLFEKDKHYYLGIMDSHHTDLFLDYPSGDGKHVYKKMEFRQAADPQKDVQNLMVIDGKTVKKNGRKDKTPPFENSELERLKNLYLPEEINRIRKKKSYSKLSPDFCKEDLIRYIEYYKQRVIEYFSDYSFEFKEVSEYNDFGEFTDHVNSQAYQIKFVDVDETYVYSLVDAGKLYLFRIHNKDFSDSSKGNINLHTIYFKMLFDERNLKNVVYKLNGGAEVFYRPASIEKDEMIIHKAGEPIENKNPLRKKEKSSSVMPYDIVKDRRYTEDKFMLHVPITMNFGALGANKYNDRVNNVLRNSENVHVIGIDRGERNLLYVVVVDSDGNIVEQISLNSIVNNEYKIETDYHALLKEKENSRDKARKDWKTIENIKELKEGYLSQVVHVISQLVIKYNAIVCLEDLKDGFMRGRQKVERQVYQKFEKMLIDKLNYLVVDKDREQKNPEKVGGALNALQLTAPFTSFKELGKQTGIIYYVPAYLTSKIDPTTGFSNLFKHKNKEDAKSFFNKFDCITYNSSSDYFEFSFDYKKFTAKADGTQTKWVACSHGKRIRRFRNEAINNNWDEEEIELTLKFKELFDTYGIKYFDGKDIKEDVLDIDDAKFYKKLMGLFNLMMQMRNSSNDGKKDYIISPIMNAHNEFFDSSKGNKQLPCDADANGAYNIARKGLWILEQIACSEPDTKIRLAMTNKEWLSYAQEHCK